MAKQKKVDMRDWMNKNTVSALDLIVPTGGAYRTLDVTIERLVASERVQIGPKMQDVPVAYFRKAKKKMVLRPVHVRALVSLFGTDPENMKGKKIRLYVELDVRTPQGPADCVRIAGPPTSGRAAIAPPAAPEYSRPTDLLPPEPARMAHMGPVGGAFDDIGDIRAEGEPADNPDVQMENGPVDLLPASETITQDVLEELVADLEAKGRPWGEVRLEVFPDRPEPLPVNLEDVLEADSDPVVTYVEGLPDKGVE